VEVKAASAPPSQTNDSKICSFLLIHCVYDSGMDTTSADRDILIMDYYKPQCILLNYKKNKTKKKKHSHPAHFDVYI